MFQVAAPRLHDWASVYLAMIGAHCSFSKVPVFFCTTRLPPIQSIFENTRSRQYPRLRRTDVCFLVPLVK